MRSGTVLVVEDEEGIATLVRTYLERDGFGVAWARNGQDALAELDRREMLAVILDIGLPDLDGFELCRRIRQRRSLPILMLTARDEEVDRVAGLELGADDYITKPFSPRELIARLKAVLRRLEPRDQERDAALVLGDVEIRPDAREVLVGGAAVELRGKEFDLLCFLVENRGIVLSRDQLLDRVWGLAFPGGTRTVDVHVASLRRKLDRADMIQTHRGYGYKAVAP